MKRSTAAIIELREARLKYRYFAVQMLISAVVVFVAAFWAHPASARMSTCSTEAAQAAAPPGMTISNIPDLRPGLPATTGGVAALAAGFFGPGSPAVCLITGSVVTNQATGKTANFGALIPTFSNWNHRFMFEGCGGNCGSVNVFPTTAVLAKGYPVWATDDGHLSSNLAWEINAPGVANEDAIVDFAYRAVHTTIVDGKEFTRRFMNADRIEYSYYEGCSDGGREGMVEANRYPEDFDGMLAGDPYFDVGGQNIILSNVTVQFQSKDAQLSPALLALASTIVLAQCDGADGVKDGLIQNPSLCHFNPHRDLPRCRLRAEPTCFTHAQMDSLSTILAAMVQQDGRVVHPGFTPSDINTSPGLNLATWTGISTPPSNFTGPEPWPNDVGAPFDWNINDQGIHYWAYLGAPGYNSLTTLGFVYRRGGPGPIDIFHTVAPTSTVDRIYDAMSIASGDFPHELSRYISKGGKLILYHGYSDGWITPYTTIQYYQQLASINGGFDSLRRNVKLFMVPGQYHCSGGPGPYNFGQSGTEPAVVDRLHDATTALEQWVEKATPPQHFIGTKFVNDDPTQPVARTMPLCQFPGEAHYRGGNINNANSWECFERDGSLLTIGVDGFEAGLAAPLFHPRERGWQ